MLELLKSVIGLCKTVEGKMTALSMGVILVALAGLLVAYTALKTVHGGSP